MKYCLFDGGDVVGPFTAKQLLLRPGFGAHSLVCPEEHSDEEAFWKEAHFYEEFGFDPLESPRAPSAVEAAESAPSEQFLKEMDSVMTELSSFNVGEKAVSGPHGPAEALSFPRETQTALAAGQSVPAPSSDEAESLPPAQKNAVSGAVVPEEPVPPKTVQPDASSGILPGESTEAKKESSEKQSQKISSVLLQASEEMKRRRVGREAVSRAEELQKVSRAAVHPSKTALPPVAGSAADSANANRPEADKAPSEFAGAKAEPIGEAAVRPAAAASPEEPVSSQVQSRTVGQTSPIEEYFNTIKSGDLGNILGIPDPKENSDMNLVRALESQFEKTDPGTGKPLDDDPFDEFTPKEKTASPGNEILADLPEQADRKTEANLTRSLPDLKAAEALPLAGEKPVLDNGTKPDTLPPSAQEMIVPEQEDDPNDKTVKTILEGKLKVDTLRQEIPEPIKEVPAEEKIPQTGKNVSAEPAPPHVIKRRPAGATKFVFLAAGAIVLLTGAWLNWKHESPANSVSSAAAPEVPAVAPQTPAVPAAREAIHALPSVPAQDPLELAKEIVQNYRLDKGRGTVEEYLNRRYSKQLRDGYAAVWSAEPLHRNSYVVKYRLAKTRKEPIVYIFQADTDKKKLTGALNNITLDLVGKIS